MGWQWHCTHPRCNASGTAGSKREAQAAEADHWLAVHATPKWRRKQ